VGKANQPKQPQIAIALPQEEVHDVTVKNDIEIKISSNYQKDIQKCEQKIDYKYFPIHFNCGLSLLFTGAHEHKTKSRFWVVVVATVRGNRISAEQRTNSVCLSPDRYERKLMT
jgi:hypothetical protein